MGSVYRARDVRLDRDVALKILSSPYREDPGYVDRFLSEARTAASISNPNLVHVYDSGSEGDLHYIAMELLEGYRPLRDIVRGEGRMPVERAVAISREVLGGLRAVHARGLLHCDVKSGNVMVRGGSVKLIDFGIARSRSDEWPGEQSIGSLHYMAPEQLLGQPLTAAADVYSAAVVLYESLTGELPYRGSNPSAVAHAQHESGVEPPRRLSPAVSPELERVVLRALERDPTRRFQSADDMAAALEDLDPPDLAEEDRTEPQAPPGYRYMPPPGPARTAAPGPAAPRPPASRPELRPHSPARPRRARGGTPWGAIAIGFTLVALAALVWVGLQGAGFIRPGSIPGLGEATETPGPGEVRIPDVVGLSEDDAIAAASAAGLNWTLRFQTNPEQPVGVYAQDPPAGTIVRAGASFEFWSNRHP